MFKKQQLQKYPNLIWAVVGLCIFVMIINYLYRQGLYYMGIEVLKSMQMSGNQLLDILFLAITMIIDPTVVFAICVLLLILTRNKAKGFVMIIFILLNSYCAAVMKAFDCDPRPFWTDTAVKNIGFYCPVEYGNPSGHSWFSAVFGFGILLDYKGAGNNNINIWISIAAVILMPLSRMYLGAHSLNQVLEGVLLGLAMCVMYVIKLKSLIFSFLSEFNKGTQWKYVIGTFHIIYAMAYLAHRDEQMPPEWQKNVLDKCKTQMDEQKLNTLMLLANALFVNLALGVAVGYQKLASTKEGENYLTGNWQINEQKYELKRGYILLVLIQCGCILSGLVLAGIVYVLMQNVVARYAAVLGGAYLSGYIYAGKSCELLFRYKVIRDIEI